MGYYTSYGLSLHGPAEECQKFEKDLLDQDPSDFELNELVKFGAVYAKLYDIEPMIDEIAKKHPSVLVILSGDGEDQDDIWETRWKGEEKETQQMVIPPFKNPKLFLHENN